MHPSTISLPPEIHVDLGYCIVSLFRDFLWCPSEHLIAYWIPEQGQIPAKIIVVEIPSRKELSTKNRHLVSDVRRGKTL